MALGPLEQLREEESGAGSDGCSADTGAERRPRGAGLELGRGGGTRRGQNKPARHPEAGVLPLAGCRNLGQSGPVSSRVK